MASVWIQDKARQARKIRGFLTPERASQVYHSMLKSWHGPYVQVQEWDAMLYADEEALRRRQPACLLFVEFMSPPSQETGPQLEPAPR